RRRHGVVHHFPFKRSHRSELLGFAGPLDFSGHLGAQFPKDLAPRFAIAADVEHEPAPGAGDPVHSKTSELLERLQNLTTLSHQFLDGHPYHGDQGTVSFDIHIDVTIEIGDVEEALDVVGGNVGFPLECLDVNRGGLFCFLGHRYRRVRPASGVAVAHDKLSPYIAALYAVRCADTRQGLSPTHPRSGSEVQGSLGDPPDLLPAGPLGPWLPLRLLTFDLRLFRFLRLLTTLSRSGFARRRDSGLVLLPTVRRNRRELAVEEVLLAHGPEVGGDPVDQDTDRHRQT